MKPTIQNLNQKRQSKFLISLTVLLFSIVSFSQSTLSGKVTDERGKPVSGANIYIEGTYDGATANETGDFTFTTTVSGNQTLVVSFLIYETTRMVVDVADFKDKIIKLKYNSNTLDAVVITAGTMQSGDKARVSVLKPLDILTTAGNPGDIISAFKTLPGTQIAGESGKLFVRGGEANETQTFIDGIRVAQPYLQTANNVPTRSTFSPLLFEGTTFSAGGYSAEYGEALSSVLIMNTIDEPDHEKTDISLMTVGLGIGNTQKWKNNSLSFNTQYINLKPYQRLLPDNIEWKKPYQSIGGESVFRHHFESGLLKVYVSFANAHFELNQKDINSIDKIKLDNKNNNLYTNTSYKGFLGSNWKIEAGFSFGYNQNKGVYDVINFGTQEKASHFKVKIFKPISRTVKTSFGAEYFNTNFDEKANGFGSEFNSNLAAFFSETDILFTRNFIAKIGFRATRNYLLDENSIAPRIALAYKVAKNKQFSFAYGTFEQAPRQEYLKYDTNLQSEKAQHYILNYEYNKDKQLFKAEAYFKNYDNLVKYDSNVPQFNSQYNNNGTGYAKGLELYWKDGKNIKNLEYWVSYSYIDTEREYKNYPTSVTPSFIADHTVSLVGKYWIQDWRSQIGATYSFASGRPYNNPNETQFMNGKTKSYNSLSMNWAYLLSPQKILFFSVSNVLGSQNVFGYEYAKNSDVNGFYNRKEITPTADRFFFVGFFWTISSDKKDNQLKNL
jgi:outer membrane cobalamin receptor